MDLQNLPLGRHVDYPREYDAGLLFPIARALGRAEIDVDDAAPGFIGHDRWHVYELSWLDSRGKPVMATATLTVPADSPNLVESKSLKLYLNSFNATRVDSAAQLCDTVMRDLSRVAGAPVQMVFGLPPIQPVSGPVQSLDDLDVEIAHYGPPRADLLRVGEQIVEETLQSALLKSNCPVTGQPDWATVTLAYRGPQLQRDALLRYLVSFRDHCEFHEQCVERIFTDVMRIAQPQRLSVEARYTRRGGLDINPWRATPGMAAPLALRDERQ